MAFYPFITPGNNYNGGGLIVQCPHCGGYTGNPKAVIIKHEKRVLETPGLLQLFPSYRTDIIERNGFQWNCQHCKSTFETGTKDMGTRIF